jgi:hypothetical protein
VARRVQLVQECHPLVPSEHAGLRKRALLIHRGCSFWLIPEATLEKAKRLYVENRKNKVARIFREATEAAMRTGVDVDTLQKIMNETITEMVMRA